MSAVGKTGAGLRLPEPGEGLMVVGLTAQPQPARAKQRHGNTLMIVGADLASHARRQVSIFYLVGDTGALVEGRLGGEPGVTGDLIDVRLTPPAHPTGRRSAIRTPVRTIVRIAAPALDAPMSAASEDLSATGVRIRSPRALSADTQCHLSLTLPNGQVVSSDARVVRCDRVPEGSGYRIALTFPELAEVHPRVDAAAVQTGARRAH